MKSKLLLTTLFAGAATLSFAQSNVGYAITGSDQHNYYWAALHQIEGNGSAFRKEIRKADNPGTSGITVVNNQIVPARAMDVYAAAAYDRKTGKLFIVPMRSSELRWMDVNDKSGKINSFANNVIQAGTYQDEANNITRMAIGSDGYGYAISNDGNHVYRFTTGKHTEIIDLGALKDPADDKVNTVHCKCSAWGGDIIATNEEKLILFTAQKKVFEIDIKTLNTKFLGKITGMPEGTSVNGAMVNDDNEIILASATPGDGLYNVYLDGVDGTNDPIASKISGSSILSSVSDLASGNLLATKFRAPDVVKDITVQDVNTLVYPNPVKGSSFQLKTNLPAGQYTIVISGQDGKVINNRKLLVNGKSQMVRLDKKPAAGAYFIKVLDDGGRAVATDKLIVE